VALVCVVSLAWLRPVLLVAGENRAGGLSLPALSSLDTSKARVVTVYHPNATDAFEPNLPIVRSMITRGLTAFTGKPDVTAAWHQLLTTQDMIGIKVYASPGSRSGTRPAVAAGVVESLLAAGFNSRQIVLWDKNAADLREAGFMDFVERYRIRVEASGAAGYDEQTFYETPLVGQLIYGDREFGLSEGGVGRKSFVSRLVTRQMSKIINLSPLLNHNRAGVCGNLYSLSMGSIDNSLRFEVPPGRLDSAVPEIYAMPELSDRVVLNIVDALICQYQGEQQMLLHYSTPLNELRFSKDPVALDVLSLAELERQRQAAGMRHQTNAMELYQNAALLQLGVAEVGQIKVERER
jgi:hypothetical protein